MMRQKQMSKDGLVALRDELFLLFDVDDEAGVAAPFAALVMSEVARTDRIEPWMTEAELSDFAIAASLYLETVSDYRGFDDVEGWRHGVAHGADWLLQLVLNDRLTELEHKAIMDAIGLQVQASGLHAYTEGEPDRLARPVLFFAQKGHWDEERWKIWLEAVAAPKPMDSWNEAFKSESGLAPVSYTHLTLPTKA